MKKCKLIHRIKYSKMKTDTAILIKKEIQHFYPQQNFHLEQMRPHYMECYETIQTQRQVKKKNYKKMR